jgi:hypothetical protein
MTTAMMHYGPAHNPSLRQRWDGLENWQRWSLMGAAVVAGSGLVIWGARRLQSDEPISQIGPQCSEFSLSNQSEIDATMRPMVRETAERGPVDPFAVASRYIARYAPACRSYPEEPRNTGEGELYVAVFFEVLRVMTDLGLATDAQVTYYGEMIRAWARAQGIQFT